MKFISASRWRKPFLPVARIASATLYGLRRLACPLKRSKGKTTDTLSVAPRTSFEMHLRSRIFGSQLMLWTTCPEPKWMPIPSRDIALFPGWKPAKKYSLMPRGQFVAEAETAFQSLLNNAEFGAEVQVLGNGGSVNQKGLLGLVRKAFTDYQWLSLWLSSKERFIHVSEDFLTAPIRTKDGPVSADAADKLHLFENEVMGLDKYKGGESEYLTVITFSDVYSGAISLFKALIGDDGLATKLDLVAYFQDVPREICRILSRQIKPNRYELNQNAGGLVCRMTGNLAIPCPAFVLGDHAWERTGVGWRYAMRVIPRPETPFQDGLVASIPQVMAYLHLRHRVVQDVESLPMVSFQPPIALPLRGEAGPSRKLIRRGVRLTGVPVGPAHVGDKLVIAVLFPRESSWVKEQFFWA